MTVPDIPVVRPPVPADAFVCALLHNASQEPHFHTAAARLARRFTEHPQDYVVSETQDGVCGLASLWLPEFHPTHAWVGLHLHPDHRQDEAARALLEPLDALAQRVGRRHLWCSVREDYLSAHPDLPGLGFREVHRTFGGGLHLKAWQMDTARLDTDLSAGGYRLIPARPHQHDPRLAALYALTRPEKVRAEPTIPPAAEAMTDDDALWEAAWLAWQGETLVGIALPERAGPHAWNAVLVVHPAHRRRGLGTRLLAQVARTLPSQQMTFLNTAGSARDQAYLGVLRRVGANIEPDWIAWERPVGGQT